MDANVESLSRNIEDQVNCVDDFLARFSERPRQVGTRLAEEQDELVWWVMRELVRVRSSLDAALVVLKRGW